jgi:hypothetical protein
LSLFQLFPCGLQFKLRNHQICCQLLFGCLLCPELFLQLCQFVFGLFLLPELTLQLLHPGPQVAHLQPKKTKNIALSLRLIKAIYFSI